MTQVSEMQTQGDLEQLRARLDELTARVGRLETSAPRYAPGMSSLDTAKGDYDDESAD